MRRNRRDADILLRAGGEGDHPQGGGGGCRRLDPERLSLGYESTKLRAAAAPSTAFGGPPPPFHGGGSARRGARFSAFAFTVVIALAPSLQPAAAAQRPQQETKKSAPPAPAATPAPPPDTRPYDPQLLRLSEILGALTYLRGVCGAGDADQWRARMQTLLEAEGKPDVRRDRLAGAFNHGMQGYALSYKSCTPNARVVIQRFLAEGAGLARGLENRYQPG